MSTVDSQGAELKVVRGQIEVNKNTYVHNKVDKQRNKPVLCCKTRCIPKAKVRQHLTQVAVYQE